MPIKAVIPNLNNSIKHIKYSPINLLKKIMMPADPMKVTLTHKINIINLNQIKINIINININIKIETHKLVITVVTNKSKDGKIRK
jgi:hypothetical protein